jgi:hypothetical protein
MRRVLQELSPVLHLTRVTSAFAAVGNVWFVILWTLAHTPAQEPGAPSLQDRPLWMLLAGGAVAALGLFAFGAAANDVIDVKRDRILRPDRPLAAGRMSVEAATTLVAGTLIAATLGATVFGVQAVLLTLVVAAAILVFNLAGKFVPAFGLVIIGLIYAGHMLIPNVRLRFIWPVWLVMTHALVISAVAHQLSRKVPPISRRAALAAVAGWAFWSAVLLYAQAPDPAAGMRGAFRHLWPEWVPRSAAIGPAVLAVLFAVVAWRKTRGSRSGVQAAEKVGRYGSLWLTLYACAWLWGAGLRTKGMILAGLAAAGFLGMTVLRELYGWLEQPVGYRR